MLAALTSELATAVESAERAIISGWERGMHAVRALARLGADGLAVSELRRNVTRWRVRS